MIYTQEIDTPSYLCDINDKLHIWAAVRLCQEVTEYHGNSTGIGFKTLLAQNRAWVITRALYYFYRRPDAFEKIMLSTWARGNNGLFAFRDYRISSTKGETLLTGTSYWPLIDMNTRRAIRLGDVVDGYDIEDISATDYSNLDKISLPQMDDSDIVMQRTAFHSMLDHTQHVNNSEYIRLIFDSLIEYGFDLDKPFSLELNYNHETKYNENLSVSLKQLPEAIYFKISNPRGLSVSAKIAPISELC